MCLLPTVNGVSLKRCGEMKSGNMSAAKLTYNDEIIMCGLCEGAGVREQSTLTDYHKGEYNYWNTVCEECKGSGRIVKTTKITYKPYKQEETKNEKEN